MSMNKKELAEMAALRRQLALARALNWTGPVPPDLPVPSASKHNEGWTFNTYSPSVRAAWSSMVTHGDGPYPVDRRYSSGSQGGIALYSTKLLALRALRHEVEKQVAGKLTDIDEQIAEELAPALHPDGGNPR